MTGSFQVDVSELGRLEADLRRAGIEVVDEVSRVVAKGSLNIKNEWRRRWSGHPHIKGLPRTITYDVNVVRGLVVGEIGPDKDLGGQAPLAGIIEYGSVNSAPIPGGAPALLAEAPRFERALEDLAARLVER